MTEWWNKTFLKNLWKISAYVEDAVNRGSANTENAKLISPHLTVKTTAVTTGLGSLSSGDFRGYLSGWNKSPACPLGQFEPAIKQSMCCHYVATSCIFQTIRAIRGKNNTFFSSSEKPILPIRNPTHPNIMLKIGLWILMIINATFFYLNTPITKMLRKFKE